MSGAFLRLFSALPLPSWILIHAVIGFLYCAGGLAVIFGDMNQHYCVHKDLNGTGRVHIASPEQARMSTLSKASTTSPQHVDGDMALGFTKGLLCVSRDRIHRMLGKLAS
jgi:hypothetical protein